MNKTARGLVWFGLVVMAMGTEVCAGGTPTLVQEHYRWRNDDGNESAATWKATQDTAVTAVARAQNIRLRFDIANTSTSYSGSTAPVLEFATATGGPWTQVSILADGSQPFEMASSANFANGDATTALLAGSGTFVAGKMVEIPSNAGGSITIGISQYSNFEYCLRATAKARGSTTYYFRVAAMNTYSQYATLTMAAGEANEPPVIVSPLAATGSVIAVFSYRIRAGGSEPITYGASGLPAGLTFSGSSITGTPAAAGSYSVPLTATSSWGSDSRTLALTVLANQPPVASNQSANVTQGSEIQMNLAWSDSDQPVLLAHSFSILTGPSQGTLQSYYQRYSNTNSPNVYFYMADSNYTGPDSITWKCNDGKSDSNVGTVSLTVVGNIAPVANNSTASAPSGQQGYCSLSVTHPDTGQTLTYSILGQPSHGSVSCSGSSYAYYTSESGYAGSDSFTWKCNDGKDDSNVATVTVTVTGSAPVPQNQTACVSKNAPLNIPAMYTGGGGFSYTLVKASNPAHGTVVVTNNHTFRYVPTTGYVGTDSFVWRMTYWNATTPSTNTANVTCSIIVKDAASAGNDWPQYMGDENRLGVTPQALPAQLYLQWRRDYRPHVAAWSSEAAQYEKGFEPVVVGKTMIVGSSRSDWVVALNTDTGAEKWRYFTEGPVRVAPVATSNRVYVCSDDGYIHCLSVADGSLLMKRAAGPSNRKCFGNNRVISVWPARGGPILADGIVYFMSGVWTAEGTFGFALNAATGAEVWYNDSSCGVRSYQPHSHVGPGGPPPMGYMVLSIDRTKLFIGCGNGMPASFNRADGSLRTWPQTINASSGGGQGNAIVTAYWNESSAPLYSIPVQVVAGPKNYTTTDATGLGVSGTPTSMLVADGKLFVVNSGGSIYCFGATQVTPQTYAVVTTPLPTVSDVWTTRAAQMIGTGGTNVETCVYVLGVGTGRLVEELVKQTDGQGRKPMIVVADPDAAKIATLRNKMEAAGFYGTRVAAIVGDPLNCGLPLYAGKIVASEDLAAAGYGKGQVFVEKMFRHIRPYGGTAYLPVGADQHSTFAGWVTASTNVPTAQVSRNGELSVLKRAGAIPGAVNFDASLPPINAANPDQALKPGPFGVQWYKAAGVGRGYIVNGTIYGGYDVYTGMPISDSSVPSGWHMSDPSFNNQPRTNLLTGLRETRSTPDGYGCGRHSDFGAIETGRNGCWGWFDKRNESGLVHWTGMRTDCEDGGSAMVGDGVIVAYGPGCSCDYPIRASIGLMSSPDTENWSLWGGDRNQSTIDDARVKRVGLNFGAPGDRVADDGTVWIESPTMTGPSPLIPVTFTPDVPSFYYHHSSRIQDSSDRKWVTASGMKGASAIDIQLAYAAVALNTAVAPAIDGQLDEACWDGSKPAQLCFNSDCRIERKTNRGLFRYDSSNLYVALQTQAESWNTGCENIRWGIYLSDRTLASNVHFEVYLDGRKKVNGADLTNGWTSAWSGVAQRDTSTFRCEIAIPWTTLQAAGVNTDQLVFNFHANADHPAWTSIWFRPTGASRLCPLYRDVAQGASGTPTVYVVKMYFAEPDDIAVGQRVFDIKLQGNTVASGFDIAQAAGGARKAVVREFSGVVVTDMLKVELVSVVGQTLISGIEVMPDSGPVAPHITSSLAASATVGQGFSYTLVASGTAPIVFGASGLPAGLSFDGVNRISGTPQAAGTNNITLTASNATGTDTKTLILVVSAGIDAYGIPDAWKIEYFGSSTTPGSGALDDPDHDGMSNYAEWKAGTNPADAGSRFQCSVSGVQAGAFRLGFQTVTGKIYGVCGKADMIGTSPWTVITNGIPGTGGYVEVPDNAAGAKKFYRITVR
ncbi:MAG: hypothetical protein C0404_11110 [Verrucomicrobia bacterium]|nr:hypothetical protein [Verrucomicrobiota bacterium]